MSAKSTIAIATTTPCSDGEHLLDIPVDTLFPPSATPALLAAGGVEAEAGPVADQGSAEIAAAPS